MPDDVGGGGGGGGGGALEKKPTAPEPPALRDQDDIAFGGAVDISPERQAARFQWVARGLWVGVMLVIGVNLLIAYYPPKDRPTLLSFLSILLGGLLGSAVMAGRLADSKLELARARQELDRKAAECAKLQAEFVKDLKSSRTQLSSNKKGKGKNKR